MLLCDVNVLVYAHRTDAPEHKRYAAFVNEMLTSSSTFGLSNLVLSGFLRVVTHPRVFKKPSPLSAALTFVETLQAAPNAAPVIPGPRHWLIFRELVAKQRLRGNEIPDAYLAAIAIEAGAEWASSDRGFARFEELRWRHPLD